MTLICNNVIITIIDINQLILKIKKTKYYKKHNS